MKPKTLHNLVVNHRLCLACGACVGVCAFNALFLTNNHLEVNESACEGCRFCEKTCPVDALTLLKVQLAGVVV